MTLSPETISLVLNRNMDVIIFLIHWLSSLFFLSPLAAIVIVIFSAIWYSIIDRGLINFLLVVIMRPILKGNNNMVIYATTIIEIIKALISTYLGLVVLLVLFQTDKIIVPFIIGLILWSFNFHFIGGAFRNHPNKITMFVSVLILTLLVAFLI